MTGAPLGKSLAAVTLNKKLSAPSGNSIYAGSSELSEMAVTPKGTRFQNASLIELRAVLCTDPHESVFDDLPGPGAFDHTGTRRDKR
jgi:hypothetical protein